MRRTLLVVSFALMSAGAVQAQALPYRVVFDLTSRDTLEQRAVLRWLKEVGTASPNAQMEVVMYAKGMEEEEAREFLEEVLEEIGAARKARVKY